MDVVLLDKRSHAQFYGAAQSGIGLIEILVSLTIGGIILAGVVQVVASSFNMSEVSGAQNRIQENMRYAFRRIKTDASQVGSFGCFSAPFYASHDYVHTVGDILSSDNIDLAGSVSRYNTSRLVDGTDNAGLLGSDSVLFRYASSAGGIPFKSYQEYNINSGVPTGDVIELDLSSAYDKQKFSSIEQYDILLAASCSGAVYFMVTNEPSDTPTDAEKIELKHGIPAPTGHLNEGQANRQVASGHSFGGALILGSRLRDENDEDNLEDDVVVGNWGGNAEVGTRPRLYTSNYTHSVMYQIEDSQAAQALGFNCTALTPEYCALTRDGVELVEGVESFQVEYGWHNGGDEAGDIYFGTAASITLAQWNYVDRVRITMTLNSVNNVRVGGGDRLTQKTFTSTIALKNQIRD